SFRIKETSTKKQGAVLPDYLLTEDVRKLETYKRYLEAVRQGKVGHLDEKSSGTPVRRTRRGSAGSTTSSVSQRKVPKRKA
ncbi:hypothetical protein, partial [Salmonella enterica]|uniref:hypothetical protein n=1 Tax=Salmonella enterica TaxID=28901 RepID=UPI0020C52B23